MERNETVSHVLASWSSYGCQPLQPKVAQDVARPTAVVAGCMERRTIRNSEGGYLSVGNHVIFTFWNEQEQVHRLRAELG